MLRPIAYAAVASLSFSLMLMSIGASPSAPAVRAQPLPSSDVFNQSGGAMNCAQAMGDIVWLCSGPRLLAVDVSDPAAPRVIGRSESLPGLLQALVLDEARRQAWVVAKDHVVALDLTDAARPVELGRVYVGGTGYGQSLALSGGRLWLHGAVAGTVLGVNAGDPVKPRIATTIDIRSQTGGAVAALAARGTRLYALVRVGSTAEPVGGRNQPENQIQVFDLSVGAAPLRVQTVKVPTEYVRDDGGLRWDGDRLWARIPDNDLHSWREESQVLAPAAEGKLAGCYKPVGFAIRDGRAYASCTTGFADNLAVEVFDLRQDRGFPLLARGAGSNDDPGLYGTAIALATTTLWVSDRAGRLRGLDIGAPTDIPTLRATGQLALIGEVSGVAWDADRHRLLATASDGLLPIEIADPKHPVAGPVLAGGFHVGHLDADGDRLAMEYRGDGDVISPGIQLRDLHNPTQAPLRFERNYPELRLVFRARSALSLEGSSLLLAESHPAGNRMSRWEWTPGSDPRPINAWPATGGLEAIAQASGWSAMVSREFVSGSPDRYTLSIMDMTTGSRRDVPVPLTDDPAEVDLQIVGDSLWLARSSANRDRGTGVLQIMHVDLGAMAGLRIDSYWESTFPGGYAPNLQLGASAIGDLLFLAVSDGRMRVFVSQPGGLRSVARLELPFRISDMALTPDGDWIYLAADSNGLYSIQRPAAGWEALPTPLPPTVTPTATTTATPTPSPSATATMVIRSRGWLPWIGRP